jgi:chromosome segregation ATPase
MSEDLTKKLPRTDSEKLNVILTTVQSLEKRIDRLEQQADEKRYETRPLWEKLEADIAELKQSLHTETKEIKRSLRDLSRKQGVVYESVLQIQADLRDMDERVHTLETTHNQQNSQT